MYCIKNFKVLLNYCKLFGKKQWSGSVWLAKVSSQSLFSCKVFCLVQCYIWMFVQTLFRIHGHEIFVEVDYYATQCLVKVLVNGINVFDKEVPSNQWMLVEKWMGTWIFFCVTLVYHAMFLVEIIQCAQVRIGHLCEFGCCIFL